VTCLVRFAPFFLTVALTSGAASQAKPSAASDDTVIVSGAVAELVRPILDEKAKPSPHDEQLLGNLLYRLTRRKGTAADEALVVLMCFDVGESEGEVDAVIARGRRMLPLLNKYQNRDPIIDDRSYPKVMLKGPMIKDEAFRGAVKAIQHGWHSTSDNPGC
jgi:hypothetical protein